MGRRSSHTPEELRKLIIVAATDLIERDGLGGVSARNIARAIGYSAGTLYNVFDDLGHLIVTIELDLLDKLDTRLRSVSQSDSAHENLLNLARTYLAYSREKPRLWNLLFEHSIAVEPETAQPFHKRMHGLLVIVQDALRGVMPNADDATLEMAARVLWASVHGMTSLAALDKPCNVTAENAAAMIEAFMGTYLQGLSVQAAAAVQ